MRNILLLILGIFICTGLFSQENVTKNYWTDGTAYTVSRHRLEIGIFTGSRYGLTDDLELSTHSLISFLALKLSVKKSWGEYGGFRIATEHGIFYPTQFMRLITQKGTGGLISPEFTIPQMFAIDNRVLVSCRPFENTILTAHAGFAFAIKSDKLDSRTTIDLPVFYPRLAMFYHQPEIYLGIDFQGKLYKRIGYIFDVENYLLPGTSKNYFLENSGILTYTSKKQSLRIEVGYKLCWGKYPSGNQWHLLPLIAVIF